MSRNRAPITADRATYNVCTGRLKVWLKDRLPRPEYDEARKQGFVWWPGSQCLTCVWRPWAEDWITGKGIEIEDDDTPDDTEARVERFTGYAENAEKSADSASAYMESGRANTERRQRFARRREASEVDRAAYWQHRIDRAIGHASFKESPHTIAGRIEELEKRRRQHVARYTPITTKEHPEPFRSGSQILVGNKGGRGSYYVSESRLPAIEAEEKRWLDHIDERLQYERAALAATGHVQATIASNEAAAIEVGGAIQARTWQVERGAWYIVTKVNPSTIEVFNPGKQWNTRPKIDRKDIEAIATRLRVEAGEIAAEAPPKVEKVKRAKATNRHGQAPEVFGAFGSSGSFSDDLSKPVDRWYLITKVSPTNAQYLTTHTEKILKAGGVTEPRRVFYIKSEPIRIMGRCIGPAEVMRDHPELLKTFAEFEALKARHEKARADRAAAEGASAPEPINAGHGIVA